MKINWKALAITVVVWGFVISIPFWAMLFLEILSIAITVAIVCGTFFGTYYYIDQLMLSRNK